MCSSKSRLQKSSSINGRPVLQPNCNRAPLLERRNSIAVIRNSSSPAGSINTSADCNINAKVSLKTYTTPPTSPKNRIHPLPMIKTIDYQPNTPASNKPLLKKCKSTCTDSGTFKYNSSAIVEAPGSIAAARKELVAIIQEQRKLRIAHYGRTTSKSGNNDDRYSSSLPNTTPNAVPVQPEKRCSFITPNSDPIYVAYHDEEWGVPVHDDKLLFELLVLTGAQLGSDWTSVLRKRQDFRDAFSSFDVEIVSKFSEKKMNWISAEYCIELSLIKKEFGSFDKYLWGFVNNKAIRTQYKCCQKISAKTSKSETISKDMLEWVGLWGKERNHGKFGSTGKGLGICLNERATAKQKKNIKEREGAKMAIGTRPHMPFPSCGPARVPAQHICYHNNSPTPFNSPTYITVETGERN
ncbi:hypothetical protein DH2020_036840 [Rehmannia glutinosa]|uniref:DNA-3-methyladenine glycosylase I n=1 Tax=Rehmannia glutinosa TaxID=99300 RepID=A0ABR0V2K9_REHGL